MLLNLDAGERDDEPEALWALFDVLAIACGGHAGDAASMARVAGFCTRAGIAVGAHPSYPDRAGFGRATLMLPPAALAASLVAQCTALAAHATVSYVKPHGALYHDADRDPGLAALVVAAAVQALGADVTVIGPPSGALADAAHARGLRYLREGFADRRYRADGTLVPRSEPGALIDDAACAADQARALLGRVDTLCVHGDSPGALALATAVREAVRG